ncbi:YiiX/YebB-like N1pC/P60 family cysteine hydrolase [Moheibacter sediminis]|uniref:Permuted papain-like amidase enzyme, YaeF/YiiX, C92 family n=1 Tax=Moheibacter sediminis TaxID=1434700 RepID=A0A1W2AJ28_9FLAO|nr:YiiX/YebB-like N1pC/P60 family cysteine hydrolase [Moheibacter sediminis]SMC60522.1 Permuted papain-like amidase enzyme, YaeF/YiiX, C92 family [Moheibacter sediminis]
MKFSIILSILSVIFSCQTAQISLRNGDLLFVGNSSGNLSKAIDEVTKTEKSTNFSHIALVEKSGNEIWILHAAPENGSERISLDEFKNYAKKDSSEIVIYRIKKEFKPDFENAISQSKTMLGKPYNFTYILSDTAYYCSDFVYNSFEKDSIFEMNPMTFKNPQTNEFHPTWILFYQKQNLEIPEGEPGCNPNGMAASEKLELIGILK